MRIILPQASPRPYRLYLLSLSIVFIFGYQVEPKKNRRGTSVEPTKIDIMEPAWNQRKSEIR